jgi:hypothetical protein
MSLAGALKHVTYRGFRTVRVNALMHRLYSHRLLVLTYHGVVPESHAGDRFR